MRVLNNKIRIRKLLLNLSHEINQLDFAVENLVKVKKSQGLYNSNIFSDLSKLRQENTELKQKILRDSEKNSKAIDQIERDLEIVERILIES